MVAYQFIAASNLLLHVYNTYLDIYVGFSFLVILLTIGESMLVTRLVASDQEAPAT